MQIQPIAQNCMKQKRGPCAAGYARCAARQNCDKTTETRAKNRQQKSVKKKPQLQPAADALNAAGDGRFICTSVYA